MLRHENRLLESGILIAVGTAILYCVNAAYYGGYFSPFQLDADLLDQNFHQILYNGFLKSFPKAFIGVVLYIFLRIILFSFKIFCDDWLIPKFKIFLSIRSDKHLWITKLKQIFIAKKNDKIDLNFEKHISNLIFCLVIFMFFLTFLVYFESEGHKAASTILKKIESNAVKENELITVKIDGKFEKLFYLMCGARNCAGINPKTKVIYYFPQNGHSYEIHENQSP